MEKLWIGTFTNKTSQGIYSLPLEQGEAITTELTLEHKISHPNFLQIHGDNLMVCCASADLKKGGMALLKLTDEPLVLKPQHRVLPETTEPCYITANEDNTLFFTANYFSEQLCVYQLKEGKLSLKQTLPLVGSSTHPDQTQARPHFIEFISAQKLLVCDLGSDLVYLMKLDQEDRLTIQSSVKLPEGTGPRHLCYHPDFRKIYVIGELNNSLTILSLNDEDDLSFVNTFPVDSEVFTGDSAGAIKLSNDKKYLYTTNRTKNTLSVFKLGAAGECLTRIQTISAFGEHPRDIVFNPQGDLLIVANQFSNNLTIFKVNHEAGELRFNSLVENVPEPCCLVIES